MQLQLKSLIKLLSPLKKPVTKNAIDPCFSCIHSRDGYVWTCNPDLFVMTKIDLGFTGSTNYFNLMSVLKALPDATVDITAGEGTIALKTVNSSVSVPVTGLLDDREFPDNWLKLPPEFSLAVKDTEKIPEPLRSRTVLSAINITPEWIEAASATQIIRCRCHLNIPDRFNIRGELLHRNYTNKYTRYSRQGRWFCLASDDYTFGVLTYPDNFVNVDQYCSRSGVQFTFPQEFVAQIPLIEAIVGKEGEVVITMTPTSTRMCGGSSDGGHCCEFPSTNSFTKCFKTTLPVIKRIMASENAFMDDDLVLLKSDRRIYAGAVTTVKGA